jgi:hypothetical protein
VKIYRVCHIIELDHPDAGINGGYSYLTNKKEANALQARINKAAGLGKDHYHVQPIMVDISREGILLALNTWGSHPDNG